MNGRKSWRWMAGSTLVAFGFALGATNATADHRLQVVIAQNSNNCQFDTQGNAYYGEAWGWDPITNSKACEVFTQGTTGMATCAANATQHQARFDKRKSDGTLQLLAPPIATSTWQTSWTGTSPFVNTVLPADSSCPNGSSITVYSQGVEVP